MAVFKPFNAIRPIPSLVQKVASKPYDVLDSQEAKQEAHGNPHSFLRVIKPEIDLAEDTDPYSAEVYEKGRENFRDLCRDEVFVQDAQRFVTGGDVSERLVHCSHHTAVDAPRRVVSWDELFAFAVNEAQRHFQSCLLYTSDAADE